MGGVSILDKTEVLFYDSAQSYRRLKNTHT